ncbi:hypothetical protein [uncultured Microbacterium sp.]|uniref:hypothetical protein n=1 Tax=uncultured Microbacterium sp. TaxID=191216 RepID=UPI0025E1B7D4|nr:hypothetical protein [uncultured Microbacterium sp.]
MDKPDFLLENLWLPLGVTVLGGLVLAGLAATVSKAVRRRFWSPIGRGLRWATTVRLTTTARVAAAGKAADDAMQTQRGQYEKVLRDTNKSLETTQVRLAALIDQKEAARAAGFEAGRALAAAELRTAEARADAEKAEAARVRGVAAEAINQMQRELDEAKELARKAGLEQVENHGRLMEYARAQGAAEGRAEAEAEVAAQRAAMTVRPVWRLRELAEGSGGPGFALFNVQPNVDQLSDVSLETSTSRFAFDGPSQWPGQMDGRVVFWGERLGFGRSRDIVFDVHYRDGNGDWGRGEAVLPAPTLKPVGPMLAKMDPDDPLGPLPRF